MKTLSTKVVYRNEWMSVREDEVEFADGSEGVYAVVDKPDFALVVPREADGSFWLVGQFRYPVGRRYWEFPQGSWARGTGPPEDLARAELAEETGLRAGSLRHIGHLHEAYGFSSQGFDIFLATDLVQGAPHRERGEAGMEQSRVTREELARWVIEGEIADAPSLAAFALLEITGL